MKPFHLFSVAGLVWTCLVLFSPLLLAEAPRALPEGEKPDDARLGELRTVDSYHPFHPVDSKEGWPARQEEIRRRVMVGSGIWPLPEKTALNAVIHGKIEKDDYTVERVFFESLPGHFVTGSLYRPKAEPASDAGYPGVLCPYGHWPKGRFYDIETDRSRALYLNELASGAERFENAAHSPLQARCVQLARMGCVVFHYDMLGTADSIQFLEHRRGPREHMSGDKPGEWGFVSPQATGRLQTNFGLQTWNSVRALDFLLELDKIDADRILVTGASGGATQTMMISAVDDRVKAAFPAVMVSTAMQGGCTCENTHYLRIGQGNIDIAAAVAPRPQEITAADDWTIELKEKGYPELLAHYELIGAKGKFDAHFDVHFKHNYNHVSRTHMYNFINRHFKLGFDMPVLERDFELLSTEELTVWTGEHPAPAGDQVGDPHEKAVCRWMTEDAERQIGPLLEPKSGEELAKAKELLGGAISIMIGRDVPAAEDVSFELSEKAERDGYLEMTGVLSNTKHGEQMPLAFAFPGGDAWNGKVVIWLSPEGKASIFGADGNSLKPAVKTLVDNGQAVVGVDMLYQGEFLADGETMKENRRTDYPGDSVKAGTEWRQSPVYTYGYNHSLFAQRAHDVLSVLSYVRNHEKWNVKSVSVVGLEGAGHWAAAARAVAGPQIDKLVVATDGFRFGKLDNQWDADFLPGAMKYGDVAGFLTQAAPGELWIADNDEALQRQLKASYQAAGSTEALQFYKGDPGDLRQAVVDYLSQ